ncbi:MAG: DUF1223 domain-containing protein [Alphaproteobacteria bacterium]
MMRNSFTSAYGHFRRLIFIGLTGFVMMIVGNNQSMAQDSPTFKVVELYTSQSCSSCPAADKILEIMSRDTNTITLAYHITYWDHLAWKDKLSLPAATQLQKEFNAERNAPQIYTPQMVVNGEQEFVGSDGNKAAAALKSATTVPEILLRREEENLHITLPSINWQDAKSQYRLMLLKIGAPHNQYIERGENWSRTVFYTSPVIALDDIAHEFQSSNTISLPLQHEDGIHDVVILLREMRAGRIVAAGRHKIVR